MLRLIALLLVTSQARGSGQDPPTRSYALPSVRPLRGELLLWRLGDGKAGPVTQETRVAPADRLGTKEGEYAAFVAEGGATVALKGVRTAADRGIGIERREGKLVFRVYEGKIAVQTFEQGVKIETPQGQIVAGKSYFLVEVEKDRTKVVAVDGELTFTTSLGSVTVEPGKESVAESGQKPSAPKATDAGKATEEFTRPEAASNLIKNPGFEEGLKDWGPQWHFFEGKRHTEAETGQAHSGRLCVRLEVNHRIHGAKPGRLRFTTQILTAVPGKTYLFRVYVRSEIREGRLTPLVGLGGIETPDVLPAACEKSWRMKSAVVTAKDKEIRVALEVDVESERFDGTIWIDDFFLCELPSPAKPK